MVQEALAPFHFRLTASVSKGDIHIRESHRLEAGLRTHDPILRLGIADLLVIEAFEKKRDYGHRFLQCLAVIRTLCDP